MSDDEFKKMKAAKNELKKKYEILNGLVEQVEEYDKQIRVILDGIADEMGKVYDAEEDNNYANQIKEYTSEAFVHWFVDFWKSTRNKLVQEIGGKYRVCSQRYLYLKINLLKFENSDTLTEELMREVLTIRSTLNKWRTTYGPLRDPPKDRRSLLKSILKLNELKTTGTGIKVDVLPEGLPLLDTDRLPIETIYRSSMETITEMETYWDAEGSKIDTIQVDGDGDDDIQGRIKKSLALAKQKLGDLKTAIEGILKWEVYARELEPEASHIVKENIQKVETQTKIKNEYMQLKTTLEKYANSGKIKIETSAEDASVENSKNRRTGNDTVHMDQVAFDKYKKDLKDKIRDHVINIERILGVLHKTP